MTVPREGAPMNPEPPADEELGPIRIDPVLQAGLDQFYADLPELMTRIAGWFQRASRVTRPAPRPASSASP